MGLLTRLSFKMNLIFNDPYILTHMKVIVRRKQDIWKFQIAGDYAISVGNKN